MAQRKIGILGGSFNPIHNAHLRLAVEAVEQAGLDRLDLVPAARPPHKGDSELLPFSERCRFLELALRNRPRLELNPLEGRREGPSYTVDTLEEYLRSHPGEAIHFVLGGDEFLHLPSWHRWERIPELAHILLTGRGEESHQVIREAVREHFPSAGTAQEDPPIWTLPGGGSLQVIDLPRMDISSSLIRERLRQGRSLAWLVPEAVEGELYGMRL